MKKGKGDKNKKAVAAKNPRRKKQTVIADPGSKGPKKTSDSTASESVKPSPVQDVSQRRSKRIQKQDLKKEIDALGTSNEILTHYGGMSHQELGKIMLAENVTQSMRCGDHIAAVVAKMGMNKNRNQT